MLDTAFARLRLAASLLFGLPFGVRSPERLVDGLLDRGVLWAMVIEEVL